MKRIHLLPNVITAFGLSCGLFVIYKMNMVQVGEVNYRLLLETAAILLLGALADLLDGALARAMKAESEFGGYFDSLADAITFGVAPTVVVLKSLSIPPGTGYSFLLTTGAMVFAVCGVLRLVRFNVMSRRAKEDLEPIDKNNKNFTGLPIPASAAALVSANLFLASPEAKFLFDSTDDIRAWILFAVMMILGYFMVSRWKFPSLKKLQIRVASFSVVFCTVIATVFIFYGLVNHFSVVFLIFSWGYVVIAWILSIIRLIAGRKSKTLEDFEPDEEDFDKSD